MLAKHELFLSLEKIKWWLLTVSFTLLERCLDNVLNDLSVLLVSELYFTYHADCLFSHSIKLLRVIRTVTFSFPSLHCLPILYVSQVSLTWICFCCLESPYQQWLQQRRPRKFSTSCGNRCHRNYNSYTHVSDLHNLRLLTIFAIRSYLHQL
jgi:hypothetical protein